MDIVLKIAHCLYQVTADVHAIQAIAFQLIVIAKAIGGITRAVFGSFAIMDNFHTHRDI